MKYDPSLMFQLAALAENSTPGEFLSLDTIEIPNRSKEEICGHLIVLIELELVVGAVQYADNQVNDLLVSRLTLSGHQFLACARDQTKWKKFIRAAQAGVGFVTKQGFIAAMGEIFKILF